MCQSLIFNIKLQTFGKFLRALFYRTPLGDCFCCKQYLLHKDHSRSDYSHYSFEQKKFEAELKLTLNSQKKLNYCTFQAVFLEILNKKKVKVLRFNNSASIAKSLRKIMFRSRFKNNFNKKSFMKTGTITRSRRMFVLIYSARSKKIF